MIVQRRAVLSIYNEVRALAWIGVMLIATGVGIALKKHFAEIGPLTIAFAIGAAAIGCYTWVALKRRATLDDYIVLLGALLISADVGFIEQQWHVLGSEWQRHFLLLAILHGAAAYFFGSRAVLSLSIAALAAWFGIERKPSTEIEFAIRSFVCAGVIGGWRLANRRRDFNDVFEHFAANLAFWGALILTFNRDTRWLGVTLAVPFAVAAVVYGFRSRRELFVIYGYVYGLIAIDVTVCDFLRDQMIIALYLLVSTIAVIVAMIVTHLRFRNVPNP